MLEHCLHSFHGVIKFEQFTADPYLFVCSDGADLAIFAVYVDNLIIVTKTQEVLKKTKNDFSRQFKMKD